MGNTVLTIDVGTQSLRASIFDTNGDVLAFEQIKYDQPYFSSERGYCEQNADFYLDVLCQATTKIYNKSPELLNNISAISVATFRDSAVILDSEYKPIRPAILWLDQRVVRNPKLKGYSAFYKLVFKLIGMTDAIKYNFERSPSNWIKVYEPQNWKKMKYFAPIPAYLNYKMTGNFVISNSECIGHFPLNCKKGVYFPKNHFKYTTFGMTPESMPKLVKVGSVIGQITEDFSNRSHIPSGVKMYSSGTDKACEVFGDGAIKKNVAAISLGTACTIDVVDSKYKEPEAFLPSYPAPYPNAWAQELQVYRGLWMINWFTENFGQIDKAEADKKGVSLEEHLNEEISKIHAGSDGLVLQPYWGPGLLRPNGKGTIVGFSGVHNRFHLYRAMIEGIAFELKHGLNEIYAKTKTKVDYIVLSGGGSASDVFCQIFADVFGIKCYRSKNKETTSLGCAMSCFLSMGDFKNPQDAIDKMCHKDDEFLPNNKNHMTYNKLYNAVYRHIYPSMKQIYENCKNFYLDEKGEK